MYGIKAVLIFAGFLVCAAFLLAGTVALWKERSGRTGKQQGTIKAVGITVFVALWFTLISKHFIGDWRFEFMLRHLRASDVDSIEIGRHDFRDRQVIEDLVNSVRGSRWFEVNHGGYGDSIPLRLHFKSGSDVVLDVAKFFREPGAIVGPANPRGLGHSASEAISTDLPRVLERYDVALPDCDTAHDKPCTAAQLKP